MKEREYKLFNKVRIINTGEVGYIVDIGKTGKLLVEKESEYSDDKLVYDLSPEEVEFLEE